MPAYAYDYAYAYACVASLRSTLHAGECRLPLLTGTHGTMGTATSSSAGCMLTQLRGEELSYIALLLCPKNKSKYNKA